VLLNFIATERRMIQSFDTNRSMSEVFKDITQQLFLDCFYHAYKLFDLINNIDIILGLDDIGCSISSCLVMWLGFAAKHVV
jgi:hypothetical protein